MTLKWYYSVPLTSLLGRAISLLAKESFDFPAAAESFLPVFLEVGIVCCRRLQLASLTARALHGLLWPSLTPSSEWGATGAGINERNMPPHNLEARASGIARKRKVRLRSLHKTISVYPDGQCFQERIACF